MGLVKILFYYNDILASLTGYIATLILVVLIRTRTTKELKPYSRMLLINCCVDLLFNTNTLIIGVKVEIRYGIAILMIDNFVAGLDYPWPHILVCTFLGIVYFCVFAMSVPFFYRYTIFNKNVKVNGKSKMWFVSAYGIVFALAFIIFLCVIPGFLVDNREDYTSIIDNDFWRNSDGSLPKFVYIKFNNPWFIAHIGYAIIVLTIISSQIIWCSYKIWQKYKECASSMSYKTRMLEKQLTIALIVQASCPIIVSVIPIVVQASFVIAQIDIIGLSVPLMMSLAWSAILNPLCTIMLVSPYRKAILSKFCQRKIQDNSIIVATKINSNL